MDTTRPGEGHRHKWPDPAPMLNQKRPGVVLEVAVLEVAVLEDVVLEVESRDNRTGVDRKAVNADRQ